MIEKKLFKNREDWHNFLQDLVRCGERPIYGELPDFPFVAVYNGNITRHVSISFVTKKDFKDED